MKKVITVSFFLVFYIFLYSNVALAQVINEVFPDPQPNGDSNQDGKVDKSDDEFVEIVNNTGSVLSMSGWTLSDNTTVRHTFPDPTNVPDGESIVVFGDLGAFSLGLAQSAGFLGLNNSGDIITLKDNNGNIIDSYSYSNSTGSISWAREPDITGSFVIHNNISTNPVNFSPGRDNTDNSPLPVELTTFTASIVNNNVNLNWETATEVNNYGFEVERQYQESSIKNQEWEKVGFVEGHGNSNSPKYYSYTDNAIESSGKYVYRLKQVDIDGTFEYSDELEVNFGAPEKFELSQNYPNPFNPTTSIKFNLPTDAQVKLNVFNILGEEVAELINGNISAGYHNVTFNASSLNSGIYFYRIETNNFAQIRRMMLIK